MPIITKKLDEKLKEQSLSRCKLSRLINYPETTFNRMVLGKQTFSEHVIEKILPILEVSREEFESWILADKYSKHVLELTIKNKEQHSPDSETTILATKIDEHLEQSGMSRTALSKQIIYNQSALNAIITGKRHISKSALEKLSSFFDISQEEILSWSLADNYSLDILKKAVSSY